VDGTTLKNLAERRASARESVARIGAELGSRIGALLGARAIGAEDGVLTALLGDDLSQVARRTGWSSLVIRTDPGATRASVYVGTRLLAEASLPNPDGVPDGPAPRAATVRGWFAERGLRFSELSGIAAEGGFLAAVPPDTYRLCDAMVADLEHGVFAHPANLAIPTALALAAEIGPDAVRTTTDPRSSALVDAAQRLTLSPRVRSRSSVAHVASLRAAASLVADAAGVPAADLRIIAAHFGRESSAALISRGRIERVAPCFGALPGAASSGALPLVELLLGLGGHDLRLDDVAAEVLRGDGGLEAFASAIPERRDALLLPTFAREAAAGVMALAADPATVDVVVLTGALLEDAALGAAVSADLCLGAPVVRVPADLETSALCAGLLRACAEPSAASDYAAARDRAAGARAEEDRVLDAALFGSPAPSRAAGVLRARSVNDIILAASGEEGGALPVIAIAGADNEEALLAAKLANHEGGVRIARFLLVGPYAPISDLAWELDVPLDEENYFVVDSKTPVDTAVGLYCDGLADIVMKGNATTADLLKGYFTGLKARGRTRPGIKLSHIGLFDIPGRSKLIAIADAALNPDPDLDGRAAILENSLVALRALGIDRPKVAVISSTEKPSDKVLSSVEAKELARRFAGRADLVIEGPLSVDLALSPESAREKRYGGLIRGDADLLLVPSIDVGNAIYKSLTVVGGATTAGAVIGGAAPIVLTSRGDSARSKLASIAFAVVLAKRSGQEAIR
jgi:phosphotransacetylase/butyrate kinase